MLKSDSVPGLSKVSYKVSIYEVLRGQRWSELDCSLAQLMVCGCVCVWEGGRYKVISCCYAVELHFIIVCIGGQAIS